MFMSCSNNSNPRLLNPMMESRQLSSASAPHLNVSFMMAEVPELWKEALVTAIPKVLHAQSVEDYKRKLLSWCRRFRIIPPEQHGFLPGASTTTNLVESVFDWCLALNQGKCIDVIYIDLSKAFDRVNHQSYCEFLIGLGYVAVYGGGWSLTYAPVI
ncbi:hypothetical protein COOONC_25723 [Cooperia oncophora]